MEMRTWKLFETELYTFFIFCSPVVVDFLVLMIIIFHIEIQNSKHKNNKPKKFS